MFRHSALTWTALGLLFVAPMSGAQTAFDTQNTQPTVGGSFSEFLLNGPVNPVRPTSSAPIVLPGTGGMQSTTEPVFPAPVQAVVSTQSFASGTLGAQFAPSAGLLDTETGSAVLPNALSQPASVTLPSIGVERAGPTATEDTTVTVDVVALRYYAARRDMERVGAEIQRLQALHPDWTPPDDLFEEQVQVDEQPLWDRFGAGDFVGLRREIAQLKSTNPDWMPSEDLVDKLLMAEARISINRAFQSRRWTEVTSIAATQQDLLVCSEMETMWFVGEALIQQRLIQQAYDLYAYILQNCRDPQERRATVEKASLLLPPRGTDALVEMGGILPDGRREFENVAFNPVRRVLAQTTRTSTTASAVITHQRLSDFAEFAVRNRIEADMNLLAWYYYSLEEYHASKAWFSVSGRISQDPKTIEGLVLSLRQLGEEGEAFKIAEITRDYSPELMARYLEAGSQALSDPESPYDLTSEQLEHYREVVTKERSALGAQAIGWDLLEQRELPEADTWFTRSMEWDPNEAAAIGLAVRALRARHFKTLRTVVWRYGDTYAAVERFRR